MVPKKTMLLEREDKPGVIQTVFSVLCLTIVLFLLYYAKGEISTPQTIETLANLKSIQELGQSRVYHDLVPSLMMNFFRKLPFLSILSAYQLALATVFSLFLHSILLLFYRKKWKMYHFFIVYFSAFLPFSFYVPFHFYNELYCITFIFLLIYIFDFEEIRDLVNIIIFTLLSLFSDLGVFLVYYLIFVFLSTFEKMQQKKSKTTVFFKKKNIPFRILIGYFGLFLVSIAFISIFDFFGNKSVSVIANRIFNVSIPVIFIVLVHFVLQLLIRLEEGAPEYVGALCILIASLGVGYYTFYLPQGENLDSLKKIESEILSLKKDGKISPEAIFYGRRALSDPLYYRSGLIVNYDSKDLKKTDFLILENLTGSQRQYLDRKNIPPATFISYHFINSTTLLISKDFMDRVLSDSDESDLRKSIKLQLQFLTPGEILPADKFNRSLNQLFGF
jgi:hypothetical protein